MTRGGMRGAAALAALLLAAGGFGCAYYNTFYFAKKYYAQAERSVQKSQSDKVPPDALQKYDDAIKQCTKVITYHPGSRWVDDAIYLMGACYYGKHEYENALKKFDELMANYPESDRVPWARYMSGLCHYARRDYGEMEAAFRSVLEKKPDFDRRDQILFTMARAAEDQRERSEAIRRYRELIRQFPHSSRSQEGLLRIGDLYFDAGSSDSAYASYSELARSTHNDQFYQDAKIKSADALVRMGKPEDAIHLLEPLVPPEDPQARMGDDWPARIRIHLAQAYNAVNRPDMALANLQEVTTKHAASSFAAEAQFQTGYTYEVYLDSLDAARKAYDALSKFPGQSVFREQGAARSRDLQQIESLSSEAAGDSASSEERQAEAALKIAEVYLLSQNRVPEAMKKYEEIVALYPETRMAPRAAYALAWIRLKKIAPSVGRAGSSGDSLRAPTAIDTSRVAAPFGPAASAGCPRHGRPRQCLRGASGSDPRLSRHAPGARSARPARCRGRRHHRAPCPAPGSGT
jgi:outer membrane assembly lipoprotein YfiO